MTIVADQYDLIIGVDTHAASHTLALITADTGAVGQHAQFPASPAGLRRAVGWIHRHTPDAATLIVIDGTGSYGAALTEQLTTAGMTVAEAPDVPAITRRRRGKSDAVDAVATAQAARSLDTNELRWPRATGDRTVLQVLSAAREQMSGDRTRAVNALLRTIDLGIDARRAMTTTTIATVAAWRSRSDNDTLAIYRAEAIWMARRIRVLDAELTANDTALPQAVTAQAPQLLALPESSPSSPQPSCWPGHTPDARDPKQNSPPSPAHHHCRHQKATPPDTGSTAPSTPSHWSAWAIRAPAATSPAAPTKAAPNARSCTASSATSQTTLPNPEQQLPSRRHDLTAIEASHLNVYTAARVTRCKEA